LSSYGERDFPGRNGGMSEKYFMNKMFSVVEMKQARKCNINESFEDISFVYNSPT